MKPITSTAHESRETKSEEAKEVKTGKEAFPTKAGRNRLMARKPKRSTSRR